MRTVFELDPEMEPERAAPIDGHDPAPPVDGHDPTPPPTLAAEQESEPFFPDFLFKEALSALVVFIILLLIVVYSGVPLEAKADPADTSYQPRPEWYFLFLFEMLKYFPGALEPVGTVLLPGSFVVALLLLPFFDKRPQRRPFQRPLAMVFAFGSLALIIGLTVMSFMSMPAPAAEAAAGTQKLGSVEAAGRALYNTTKCDACHTLNGAGGAGGPDLSRVGANRDVEWLHSYIEYPKALNSGATMPGFIGRLTHREVENIARYLAVLK